MIELPTCVVNFMNYLTLDVDQRINHKKHYPIYYYQIQTSLKILGYQSPLKPKQ